MRDPEYQDNTELIRYSRAGNSRKPDPNIWQRMSRVMEVIIYILIILVLAKIFTPELDRQKELEGELDRLKVIQSEKEEAVARLRREHSNLISDRKYMESIARDRLNLQREDEYIIRIER
jgi:cell division protein FtsB